MPTARGHYNLFIMCMYICIYVMWLQINSIQFNCHDPDHVNPDLPGTVFHYSTGRIHWCIQVYYYIFKYIKIIICKPNYISGAVLGFSIFIECFTTTFLRAHSWLNWVEERNTYKKKSQQSKEKTCTNGNSCNSSKLTCSR